MGLGEPMKRKIINSAYDKIWASTFDGMIPLIERGLWDKLDLILWVYVESATNLNRFDRDVYNLKSIK